MSTLVAPAILLCVAFSAFGWQKDPSGARPSFAGEWQLDTAKSKTEIKDLTWKIDQTPADISIEEISGGKTLLTAKCPIGKACEYSEDGKKASAMTYFLDTSLVQTRSAADNSSVVKRLLKLNEDGSLQVELKTIVPSDKTELLVFTKQGSATTATAAK
jgi:hypothetical protein